MRQTRSAFMLVEIPFILAAVGLLFMMLIPARNNARQAARQVENASRVRGIHMNMVIFAQGNRTYYPGLRSDGRAMVTDAHFQQMAMNREGRTGANPSTRMEIMLRKDYFEPGYCVSPGETPGQDDGEADIQPWDGQSMLTPKNYSYSLSRITIAEVETGQLQPHPRHMEWRDTSNSLAPILSDRNMTGDDEASGDVVKAASIWTKKPGQWRGTVGWNDNHVQSVSGPIMDDTQFGRGPMLAQDNLFQSEQDATLRMAAEGDPRTLATDARLVHATP